MKLVTFEIETAHGPEPRLGALAEGRIMDLNAADPTLPADIIAWLELGEPAREKTRQALLSTGTQRFSHPVNEVRLLAPVPRPGALRDFFAFEEHARQGAARRKEVLAPQWYEQPVYYKGNHREIYGPNETVPWPSYTRKLDFELEIACIVGKKGRDLSPEQAGDYIAGYSILNDFSARDIQKNEMICRMGPAKGKDFATGLGPYLLTCDELRAADNLAMSVYVNGAQWSSGNSKDRYWSFPVMLSHVSQEETVYPGDILGSGTYYKGCGLDLDRWIKPGDVIELEVEKLGRLRHVVGQPQAQKRLVYSGKSSEAKGHGSHR
ncbi:MAG: hypothetical protein A3J74_08935 [Elusimicrobia bacterium RIFCSPHIGHO2_02_FULL_57_9]|nr:MAG: hypothetical protein A3J74_08935 [Elusimicrobia bacterium RIFCSPHIGHO2_02_FULL_57_9]